MKMKMPSADKDMFKQTIIFLAGVNTNWYKTSTK